MKNDELFEKRLERQAMKAVPAAWREEILDTAREAARVKSRVTPSPANMTGTTITQIFSRLFWPHPKAWAGLAAAWVLILGLNIATQEAEPASVAKQKAPPSALMRELLQQQEQLFAELVGEKSQASPPKTIGPRPRSQRREEGVAA